MKTLITLAIVLLSLSPSFAQTPGDRERARIQNKLGWEDMQSEKWERAAVAFQNAIDIDPLYEMPHYGLGRARMALKNYLGAIDAYVRCRDLYRGQASKVFTNA